MQQDSSSSKNLDMDNKLDVDNTLILHVFPHFIRVTASICKARSFEYDANSLLLLKNLSSVFRAMLCIE